MTDEDLGGPATVNFAICEGCPAGEHGGLCQHVFALLMYGESVTSLCCSWRPNEHNVEPHSIFQLVEKSLGDERHGKGIGRALSNLAVASLLQS